MDEVDVNSLSQRNRDRFSANVSAFKRDLTQQNIISKYGMPANRSSNNNGGSNSNSSSSNMIADPPRPAMRPQNSLPSLLL